MRQYLVCFSAVFSLTNEICEATHADERFRQLWPRLVVNLIVLSAVVECIVVLVSDILLILVSFARTLSVE
jgi:hypothetical protein